MGSLPGVVGPPSFAHTQFRLRSLADSATESEHTRTAFKCWIEFAVWVLDLGLECLGHT
jgi:hypothetical protein